MLSWRRLALLAAVAIESTVAQPALTTIQDTLYRADGTRFTGHCWCGWRRPPRRPPARNTR